MAILMVLQLATARDFREFTKLKGVKIQAGLLDLQGDIVKIRSKVEFSKYR